MFLADDVWLELRACWKGNLITFSFETTPSLAEDPHICGTVLFLLQHFTYRSIYITPKMGI